MELKVEEADQSHTPSYEMSFHTGQLATELREWMFTVVSRYFVIHFDNTVIWMLPQGFRVVPVIGDSAAALRCENVQMS